MRRIGIIAPLITLLALASSGAGQPSVAGATPPDLIVHDAVVLTMDPDMPRASALAVIGDRFVAVGDDEDILALAGPSTVVIHLDGKAVTPGFIDSHSHWIGDRGLYGVRGARRAIQMALEGGWTSINEHFVNQERLDELTRLDAEGDLRLRVNAYLPVNYGPSQRFGMWFSDLTPGEVIGPRLRLAGVKFFIDACGTRTMYMSSGDPDDPRRSGSFHWGRHELQRMVRRVHEAGWQIAAHSCGDAATDEILHALELAYGAEGGRQYRDRVEHLVALRDDQIRRMRQLGVSPSIQLTWLDTNWASQLLRVYDADQLALMGRWRDLARRPGLHTIGSTDTPYGESYEQLGPSTVIDALSSAVTRMQESGDRVPAFMRDQRLSLMQAIRLLTVGGAYGISAEDDLGTITPGKLADFVVLSPDPRTVRPRVLDDVAVALVVVGGILEVCAPGYEALCPTLQ